MAFTLEEVIAENDFAEIASVLFIAFGQPYNSLRKWFIPVNTTVEDSLESFQERLLKGWKKSSDLHWIKVTDENTGNIIGVAEWEVRKRIEEPTSEPTPLNAYWHIDGSEEKRFAEQMLTQFKAFMKARMSRPHAGMDSATFALKS